MRTSMNERFWCIVERTLAAHWRMLWPIPASERVYVDLSRMHVTEATQLPPQGNTMAVQVANIEVSGDASFGGYNITGIVATNNAGHPRVPQPTDDKWQTFTSDESERTWLRRLPDGTFFLYVDDERAPGDEVMVKVSSDPDIDGDDAVINVKYIADRPGPVDVGGMQIVEATAAPPPLDPQPV